MQKAIPTPDCIAADAVKKMIQEDKELLIIDVRSPEEYADKHIPEAINIPLEELDGVLALPDDALTIITTCGIGGSRSTDGAMKLRQKGFQAFWLCGGTNGWPG